MQVTETRSSGDGVPIPPLPRCARVWGPPVRGLFARSRPRGPWRESSDLLGHREGGARFDRNKNDFGFRKASRVTLPVDIEQSGWRRIDTDHSKSVAGYFIAKGVAAKKSDFVSSLQQSPTDVATDRPGPSHDDRFGIRHPDTTA